MRLTTSENMMNNELHRPDACWAHHPEIYAAVAVLKGNQDDTFDEVKQRAHLIAASPYLYAACQLVLSAEDYGCSLPPAVKSAIRAAIAKADGQRDE